MKLLRWMGVVCLLSWMSLANAGGVDQLNRFMVEVQSYRAGFEQTVITKNGRAPRQSSGQLAFQRPGKFRWQIEKPFPQLMVGDGKRVWLYDPDLQQVTKRKVDQAIGSTPAALLAGSQDLERAFVLKDAGAADGLEWVEATPKQNESGFSAIKLGFAVSQGQSQLRVMEMQDNFGQLTRLRFSKIETNPNIAADIFRFVPPPGVDVLGD